MGLMSLRSRGSISEILAPPDSNRTVFTITRPTQRDPADKVRGMMHKRATIVSWPFPIEAGEFTKLTRRETSIVARRQALQAIEAMVLPGNRGPFPNRRMRQVWMAVDAPYESLRGIGGFGQLQEPNEIISLRERVAADVAYDAVQNSYALHRLVSSGKGVLVENSRGTIWWKFLSLVPQTLSLTGRRPNLSEGLKMLRKVSYPIRMGLEQVGVRQYASLLLAVPDFQDSSLTEAIGYAKTAGFRAFQPGGIAADLYQLFLPGSLALGPAHFEVSETEVNVIMESLLRNVGPARLDGNIMVGWTNDEDKIPVLVHNKIHFHQAYIAPQGRGKTSWANVRWVTSSNAALIITGSADPLSSTIRIVEQQGGVVREITQNDGRAEGAQFVAIALEKMRQGLPVAIKPEYQANLLNVLDFLVGFLHKFVEALHTEGIRVQSGTTISMLVDDWSAFKELPRTYPNLNLNDDLKHIFSVLETVTSIGAKPRGENHPVPFPGINFQVTTQAEGDLRQEDLNIFDKMNVVSEHSSREEATLRVGRGTISLDTWVDSEVVLDLLMDRSDMS